MSSSKNLRGENESNLNSKPRITTLSSAGSKKRGFVITAASAGTTTGNGSGKEKLWLSSANSSISCSVYAGSGDGKQVNGACNTRGISTCISRSGDVSGCGTYANIGRATSGVAPVTFSPVNIDSVGTDQQSHSSGNSVYQCEDNTLFCALQLAVDFGGELYNIVDIMSRYVLQSNYFLFCFDIFRILFSKSCDIKNRNICILFLFKNNLKSNHENCVGLTFFTKIR